MEAEDQTQPGAEPDPFAEPIEGAAPPADLPPAPPAEEPIQEPQPEVAQPPAEGAPEEPVTPVEETAAPEEEALPGEGEDRPTGDEPDGGSPEEQPQPAPVDELAQEGPGEPPLDVAQAPPAPAAEPAPAVEQQAEQAGQKARTRDYTMLEKVGLGRLVRSKFDGEVPSDSATLLQAIEDTLVFYPLHEVHARNREQALTRTFGDGAPFGRKYKGDVATIPSKDLETNAVEVGESVSTKLTIK